ncbi:RagB/SusD domain-containing protein [Mariniphaga anaerophila]|uniref:RagB/SusD domain-containing protein n=1 Tax=Mariniphaga anaerophila TaxID=1484053 RepID=A0A1M5F6L4_9BACT|nr:RagB/SusD family nutrient uptake outer membrane protein [Mariniphaga anaerophila]SHF87260.1 RagB/SusD domain-containing protein [Mariniphaga anaerophila]
MKKLFNLILIIAVFATSCSDEFLETIPTNEISDQAVFQSVEGAQTVIDGVLRDMRSQHGNEDQHDQFGVKAIDLCVDLMGEDMVVEKYHWFGADYRFENRTENDQRPLYAWTLFYRIIYNANEVINHIDDVASDSETLKADLKAQALTLRAYSYFQLVQLFQHTYSGHEDEPGVPLYTNATTEGNPRSTVSEVYTRITTDLSEAVRLFEESGLQQKHISRPALSVARGLAARVALVMEDWQAAADMASKARDGFSLMTAAEFSTGFDNYTQQNWMWGMEVNSEQSTTYASWFSHVDWTIGGYCGYGLSPKSFSLELFNRMDNSDVRKELVDTSFIESGRLIPYKFAAGNDKGFDADLVLMRPEEMLLIEAEARARIKDFTNAGKLLKELRDKRFDEPVSTSWPEETLLSEILLERRIELWGEGFRGFDLKRLKLGVNRTNSNHNPVVAKVMSLPAESEEFIYQIPQSEIDANSNIGEEDQNL